MRIELENQPKKESPSDSFIPPKDERRTPKSEWKKMKEMSLKDAWRYFLDYYRNPLIVTIIAIVAVISLVYTVIQNRRPYVISIAIYNNYLSDDTDTDAFCQSFAEYMGMNLKDYQMLYSASDSFDLSTMSEETQTILYKLAGMIASSDLDILGGDREFIDYYGNGETDDVYFYDLEEVLPDDLYTKLEAEDRLFYSSYEDEDGNATGETYLSSIEISGTRLTEEGGLLVTPCYIGIVVNSERVDTAIEFLRWIFYME